MRIAQIVASLESRHGGPSRSVRALAGSLAGAGHPVALLGTAPVDEVADRNDGHLTTRLFRREWPETFAPSAFLRADLAASDYDVLHNHGLWLRPLHYAARAAAKSRAPLVISPRGMMTPWAWNHRRFKKTLAAKLIHPGALTAAAGWHATSEAEAMDIRRLGFNQPVCVAPNGVDAPSPQAEAAAGRHWCEREPSLVNRRVALFYSRLHAKKRVLELIDLWLSKARGDWILLIVGIPEQYSVKQLETYLLRNGGQGLVIVHNGASQPPPYAAASLFLLPSHSENFGLVVAEALVRGLPVLTTDTTPWSEVAARGVGECVPWENYGRVLDAWLAESPEALRDAGRRGQAWASAAFSWDLAAQTLLAFYAQLRARE
jgi:glycosyltransferase involved in cell wall biosynthesis